jgi:hypothetical protein
LKLPLRLTSIRLAAIRVRVVHLHHAEPVAGRRFHHPPALDEGDLLRPELLQARGFGIDVVGFDVQVHADGWSTFLHFDMQLAGRVAEHLVGARYVTRIGVGDAHAEGLAPERRGGIEIARLAVDDETGEAAAVGHGAPPLGRTSARPLFCQRCIAP